MRAAGKRPRGGRRILGFADGYWTTKRALSAWSGMSEDLLHVHLGLLIFVVAALLFRRRLHSPLPLAAVAVVALANEVIDVVADPGWEGVPAFWDVVNTLLWPTVLFLVARRRQALARD
jgi:hypothetical protein